ncbi:oxysterol-binding protein-related protein 9 isoform X2 [Oratosquilla oratoria]|uniref:oxysterol-binding protein-related protein 9 isoform X2 n=1 Tax=Oratosquilla oratoria TaxID=337810 RepID=UPI003F758C08
MAVMEGPLSKWTNVMKGWQYRWFVLDDSAGLLSYYTSKEKMVRGARRGCVRLKGAVVGIDDDDDSTFTITVDAKTFHFQRWDPSKPAPTMADFDKKLTESDAYLQLLIDQSTTLEKHISSADDELEKQRCQTVLDRVSDVLESIKHSIVLLQIAKNTAFPVNGVYHPCNAIPETHNNLDNCTTGGSRDHCGLDVNNSNPASGFPTAVGNGRSGNSTLTVAKEVEGIEVGRECAEAALRRENAETLVPETSYSSSEDEDFFDANEFTGATPSQSPSGPRFFEDAVENISGSGAGKQVDGSGILVPLHTRPSASGEVQQQPPPVTSQFSPFASPTQVPTLPSDHLDFQGSLEIGFDYDAMYEDEDDEELGSMEGHGSVIHHLLSQVKIGMDLTKVVLPTFILERRSLLEMYADFFAHPDLFCRIPDFVDPCDRMVQVVKWYLSAFHAGRKSEVAKKPYNPILGEIFRCYWDVPGEVAEGEKVVEGPIPWAYENQLAFVAEQVSHHPPISAFYAENKDKGISFCGHIWTKSKFLGLSICVNNIGQGCVSLLDYDEEYIINFPSGYGRSILTVPWVELGGTCQITCGKTGYSANIEFLTKPFYGGRKHRIAAEIFHPNDKKPFLNVEGEWNGIMQARWNDGRTEVFVDTQSVPTVKKKVEPIAEQQRNESRYLWREVTAGLKFNMIDQATRAKTNLEQKQRNEAKYRKENNFDWDTKLFSLVGENWIYDNPLQQRWNK